MNEQIELKLAITQWQGEVDRETINLIEAGVPPYEAGTRAVETVSNKRRNKYADKSGG